MLLDSSLDVSLETPYSVQHTSVDAIREPHTTWVGHRWVGERSERLNLPTVTNSLTRAQPPGQASAHAPDAYAADVRTDPLSPATDLARSRGEDGGHAVIGPVHPLTAVPPGS